MKKLISGFLILGILFACNEEKSDKNLHISGNVKGLKKGTLYLKRIQDSTMVTLDSIKINGDSHFESELSIDSPEMLYLVLDRGTSTTMDTNLLFFAEPGNIVIETELDYFYANAKITGSKNQELYEAFKKINSRFNDQQLELTESRFNSYKANDLAAVKAAEDKYNSVLKRKYLFAINFAITNKAYEVAPYIALSEINNATIKYLDTIQKSMTPKVAQSKYGLLLSQYIEDRKKLEN